MQRLPPTPTREVASVRYATFTAEDVRKYSVLKVTSSALYTNGVPDPNGVLSPYMGNSPLCPTCFKDPIGCNGHLGHVTLYTPILNPNTTRYVQKMLNERKGRNDTRVIGKRLFRGSSDVDVYTVYNELHQEYTQQRLLILPNVARPTVRLRDNTTNEDDLTMRFNGIVHSNRPDYRYTEQVQQLYNEFVTGKTDDGKQSKGIYVRLKGKQGRFRHNITGKRVEYTARTVISPDPALMPYEVGIPEHVARTLTYPERTTAFNQRRLNGLIRRRRACYLIRGETRIDLRVRLVEAEIGDVVERNLENGDFVLFNRQPSLHRQSLMAHRVRILKGRTFRLNECVCTPYNADFDGDEMNVHVLQDQNSRAEALVLALLSENIETPKNGNVLIACVQDFITGSYLLSSRECYLSTEGCDLLAVRPRRAALLKPRVLYTGKQVLSCIFRDAPVSYRQRGRCYTTNGLLCQNDGDVLLRQGEILFGRLDKSMIGADTKAIFSEILKSYGGEKLCRLMHDLSLLAARYLMTHGVSLSYTDLCDAEVRRQKALSVQRVIKSLNQEEGRRSRELSGLRDEVGGVACKRLSDLNAVVAMYECGSKGSKINVAQMVGCVGQQIVSGQRIPLGFEGRTLPHYRLCSSTKEEYNECFLDCESRGFVSASFSEGLTATQFFFHTVSGREGLVDTAVKTAETGYMQRRLVKVLEDVVVAYDGTVRNSANEIVQFAYGDDGLKPEKTLEDAYEELNSLPSIEPSHFKKALTEFLKPINERTVELLCKRAEALLSKRAEALLCQRPESPLVTGRINTQRNTEKCTQKNTETNEKQLGSSAQLYKVLLRIGTLLVEPGTPVGAICAESIGEPGTQMTLKTFHFAGVSAMNVTQGVPRLKEIINGNKKIETPITTIRVWTSGFFEEVGAPLSAYATRTEELYTHEARMLRVYCPAAKRVVNELVRTNKLDASNVVLSDGVFVVKGVDRDALLRMHVFGFRNARSIVESDSLYIEGEVFQEALNSKSVEFSSVTTNDVHSVYCVLGIEAARCTIIREINDTMQKHGISVCLKHIELLADVMCSKGEVLGVTRFGIAKMRVDVFRLASFERTVDHLVAASLRGAVDRLNGVSENVVMGKIARVGSGYVDVCVPVRAAWKAIPLLLDAL